MRVGWIFALVTLPVLAHQASLTPSGKELYWHNRNVPLQITSNTTDMNSTMTKTIIRNSMAQWNASSVAKVNEVTSSLNEIKFIGNYPYGSAVLGMTEISYNSSGSIQKAVITLNDDYLFRDSPGLYPSGQVFLGDVVTHEIGHLFGLSHSEVLNAAMFYSSFSGQSEVSLDDRSGIRQKYDTSFGKIIGKVQGGNHIGVLGVHVQAVSLRSGETSAAITDENGEFVLGGLDFDDTYYLYTSPIKNPDSLPGYFSNVQTEFCPASYKGSFFSSCGRENDGKPQGIPITAATSVVDVGVISINCGLRSDEDYTYQKLQSTFAPVTIFDYQENSKNEQAFVGWFRKSIDSSWSSPDILRVDLTDYPVLATNKYLKISLVSYPFGTQMQYEMKVKKGGVNYPGASRYMSYSGVTETYNPDFEAFIPLDLNTNLNEFEIRISAKKLENFYLAQMFPSVETFTSSEHLPYLIVSSLWEYRDGDFHPLISSEVLLSDNSACLDAPFTYAVSKTSESSQSGVTTDQAPLAAGCGTINPPQGGSGGGALPLLLIGFLLTLLPNVLINSGKKFLS